MRIFSLLLPVLLVLASSVQAQCGKQELQEILASDGVTWDDFGQSVGLDNGWLVVGATDVSDRGTSAGAAYFFESQGGTWVERQKVFASDADRFDDFGRAAVVCQDVAVIGAPKEDSVAADAGAVYVFRRVGGQWVEEAKLTASDGAAVDYFGWTVAMASDVVVVGAFRADDRGKDAGAAYVFRHDGTKWKEEQKLFASDASAGDGFGLALDVEADVIAVGSRPPFQPGRVYLFRDSGGSWLEEAKVSRSGQQFGASVSLSGNWLAVGSSDEDLAARDGGAAFLYEYNGRSWLARDFVTASDARVSMGLGAVVDLDGPYLVVSAPFPGNTEAGLVYAYHDTGTDWVEVHKLTGTDSVSSEYLGRSVALDGRTLVAGAIRHTHAGVTAGAAYAFDISDLGLDSNLDVAMGGNTLQLWACGGVFTKKSLLYVVEVNGVPLVQRVDRSFFDTSGRALFGGPVPAGLAGLQVDFMAFGEYLPGRVGASNPASVTFQ